MPFMDIMREDCLVIKLRQSVSTSAVLTLNADLLTLMKSALDTTVLSLITPKRKLGIITKKTVDTSGTIMKLKLVGSSKHTKIHTKTKTVTAE